MEKTPSVTGDTLLPDLRRRGRATGTVLFGDSSLPLSCKSTAVLSGHAGGLPTLSDKPNTGSPAEAGGRGIVMSDVSPCPQFDRLRDAALEDRMFQFLRMKEGMQHSLERQKRRYLMLQSISMDEYYKALYRPEYPGTETRSPSASLPAKAVQGPLTKKKRALLLKHFPKSVHEELVNDIENSFIACYYKQNPDKLKLKEENEKLMAERRSSVALAARLSAVGGSRLSKSLSLSAGRKPSKRPSKKSRTSVAKEGAPAKNLAVLQSALLMVADKEGLVTPDAFQKLLSKAPFEVTDQEAVDSFFAAIHAFTGAKENTEGETPCGLETSQFSLTGGTGMASGRASQQQRFNTPMRTNESGASLSIGLSTGANTIANRQRQHSFTQSISISKGTNMQPNRISTGSPLTQRNATVLSRPISVEIASLSPLRVRDLLAVFDALINGPELRDVIRGLCFSVLEIDGFIHKATLKQLRHSRRENCEGRDAVVTPSVVKAMGDAFNVLLAEEEQKFIRAQMKGKRGRKSNKAATLLPHQKSSIPLNMMRCSHISMQEFTRLFDEMPLLAAAFSHVWLPALFSRVWPPVKGSPAFSSIGDDQSADDDCPSRLLTANEETLLEETRWSQESSVWDKVTTAPLRAVLANHTKRRNMIALIIGGRMEAMAESAAPPPPEPAAAA
ncbi:hypothetical protein ERJ75_001321100 [Trypanosoma vivax]|nr:hypothetical protein TRVL_05416 [Trypanosoma vivax]KAH8607851.1 hypothetical protein ERJ75_001321100 [Trypanosoma vivax]